MPKERGRILFVTSTFPRWKNDAMPGFVFNLAQDLQELGWRIDVLAPHAPRAAICEILGDVRVKRFRYLWPESAQTVCYEGSSLVSLRTNRWNGAKVPSLVLFELLAILRSLAREKYDILHSHWILPQGFTGALAAIPFRVPHVLTVHGGDVFALRGSIFRAFKRFAIRHADAVTVNSTATETAVREIAPAIRNLRRIPMGVSGFDSPATSRAAPSIRDKARIQTHGAQFYRRGSSGDTIHRRGEHSATATEPRWGLRSGHEADSGRAVFAHGRRTLAGGPRRDGHSKLPPPQSRHSVDGVAEVGSDRPPLPRRPRCP